MYLTALDESAIANAHSKFERKRSPTKVET